MEIRRIELNNFIEFDQELIITIGAFDGIHAGHNQIFDRILEEKRNRGDKIKTAVFTFGVHPDYTLNKRENHGVIDSEEMRFKYFEEKKIDYVFLMENSILSLDYKSFHKRVLSMYNTKVVVVGADFKYGSFAYGNVETLKEDYEVISLFVVDEKGNKVSSSDVRKLLEMGNVSRVKYILGHNYYVEGLVCKGAGLGRKLGFPTANLELKENYYFLLNGVYETRVYINEKKYIGITNVGKNPTVNTQIKPRIETFILDFDGDLYGKVIRVEFIDYIRGEKKFESVDELVKTIEQNIMDLKMRVVK